MKAGKVMRTRSITAHRADMVESNAHMAPNRS